MIRRRIFTRCPLLWGPLLWASLASGQPAEDPDEVIIVTGARPGPGASPASTVGARILDEDAGAELSEILNEQPGLRITRLGGLGAFSTLSIRGSTSEQVAFLLDGVPLNQAAGGPVDVSTLPLGPVGEVQIYRHVVPIELGVTALGGAVALRTRRPDRDAVEMSLGVGRFGDHVARGRGAVAGSRWGLGVAVDHRGSQGDFTYIDDGGTRFDDGDDVRRRRSHNRASQTSALVNGHLRFDGGALRGIALAQRQGRDLPGLGNAPATAAAVERWRGLTGAELRLLPDPWVITVTPFLTVSQSAFRDPASEIGVGVDDAEHLTTAAGLIAAAKAPLDLSPRWQLVPEIVLTGRRSAFTPSGTAPGQRVATDRQRGSAAAGLTLTDERWRLIAEGRYSALQSEGAGASASTGRWTGRLGASRAWGDPDHGLRLSADLVRAARFPDLFELFGDTGTTLGNPSLRPEGGWQGDVGLIYSARGARWSLQSELHGFGSQIRDLIQFERNSQGVLVAHNVEDAALTGAELGLWGQLGHRQGVRIRGAYTALLAESRGDIAARADRRLPLRPGRQAFARVEAFWPRVGLSAEVDHTADNYLDFANLVAVPARTIWGAGAWWNLEDDLRLDLTARNLTDRQVVDLAGYPLPGWSLMARITARYEGPHTGDAP